ncbi:conserved hypothetical protein [Haloferula helveola]|uniref:TIR domain-containing protein n=1 Tax=Haloferula helveola TaxID=490095 RepID=A0ABN6H7Q8_9BACT|nr:conserved hypothetical protein [Haloferula helveola]
MRRRTPVRIYVLWHKSFAEGLPLARHIYHWFRLPSGEGIPVYFRCAENPFGESFPEIREEDCDHNIIIPLVEPNMVASMPWRRKIEKLANTASDSEAGDWQGARCHLLPIALHDTAYQMPSAVRRLNFIRKVGPSGNAPDEVLMSRLTEALCLLLRGIASPGVTDPIKIFLSHAKADGTDVPKEIKSFIQNETQAHTFFDENDIAYGHDFAKVIEKALQTESAGLLVVQGDHYADRPWCRKEIRDFLEPRRISESGEEAGRPALFSVMPSVVVSNFEGNKVARTIPELGHAPSVQWKPQAARSAVVTLLREILFSNFYRLLARRERSGFPDSDGPRRLLVNRPPDPVMVEQLLQLAKVDRNHPKGVTIHHPGHGLTSVELEGLQALYGNFGFHAFGARIEEPASVGGGNDSGKAGVFAGRVLAISAGNACDILKSGFSDDHTVELLTAILHPLFKKDISLLYGGGLPKWDDPDKPWISKVNYTHTFLGLLLAERDKTDGNPSGEPGLKADTLPSRLFNLSAWPHSLDFTIEDEARWVNTCSFLCVTQGMAGIPADEILGPEHVEEEHRRQKILNTAVCLTAMRRRRCGDFTCDTPERENFEFQPIAHLFVGGKLRRYSGMIPGVWEEMLHAYLAERPCFVVRATRGAAGRLGEWLLNPPVDRPVELSVAYQARQSGDPEVYRWLADQLDDASDRLGPTQAFDQLWQLIQARHDSSLSEVLRNKLSDEENEDLLRSGDFGEIARLIGKGLERLAEPGR